MNKFFKRIAVLVLAMVTFTSFSTVLAEEELPTEETPMIVDKEAGTIKILAYVNGKYLETSTRHAVVFDDGNFGGKSVYGTKVNQNDFYAAMMDINAKPGDNMNADNAEVTFVEGDIIDITVNWEGADKEYTLGETVIDSNGKEFEFRFGGNQATAEEKHTGCITCLDSCPVGLISNSAYTYGAVEKRAEVEFFGNKDILPEDGTPVIITYSVHEEDADEEKESGEKESEEESKETTEEAN